MVLLAPFLSKRQLNRLRLCPKYCHTATRQMTLRLKSSQPTSSLHRNHALLTARVQSLLTARSYGTAMSAVMAPFSSKQLLCALTATINVVFTALALKLSKSTADYHALSYKSMCMLPSIFSLASFDIATQILIDGPAVSKPKRPDIKVFRPLFVQPNFHIFSLARPEK
jgi:hypothetical protein